MPIWRCWNTSIKVKEIRDADSKSETIKDPVDFVSKLRTEKRRNFQSSLVLFGLPPLHASWRKCLLAATRRDSGGARTRQSASTLDRRATAAHYTSHNLVRHCYFLVSNQHFGSENLHCTPSSSSQLKNFTEH
jgi:hypothetical protein